ncbi:MAG: hypothetical protein CSA62_15160 [Planctomycetota bacterium]|nr:MAG: hypothetical protein CSA62_15160 [Planctomycetota bacterium]
MRVLSSIPVLPSLITLGNAFCGVLVVVKVVDLATVIGPGPITNDHLARIEFLGLLILLAMFFDALDGKVARLTSQTSDFGAQLDSLSDAITFGVAPAVLVKFLIDKHATGADSLLPAHPKIYYACAALYVLAAVLRLARFQVLSSGEEEGKEHMMFKGLPSPAAALVLVSIVLFYCGKGSEQALTQYLATDVYRMTIIALPFALAGSGILMVSTLSYPHLANHLLSKRQSFLTLSVAVFILILAALEWQVVGLILAVGYVLLGPIVTLWSLVTGSRDDEGDDGEDADDDDEGDEGEGTGPGKENQDGVDIYRGPSMSVRS